MAGPAGHKAQERGARRIPLEPGVSGSKGYRVPPVQIWESGELRPFSERLAQPATRLPGFVLPQFFR